MKTTSSTQNQAPGHTTPTNMSTNTPTTASFKNLEEMEKQLSSLEKEAITAIRSAQSVQDCDSIKTLFFSKKGHLTELLKHVSNLPIEARPQMGKRANQIKTELLEALTHQQAALEKDALLAKLAADHLDISLPANDIGSGKKHPINQAMDEILSILTRLGFSIKDGPDIENDITNFESLNIAENHPARDMHDTFYFKDIENLSDKEISDKEMSDKETSNKEKKAPFFNAPRLLRTHTSPVQIRTMKTTAPPLKIAAPGKVYRVDADVSHSPVFHQIEGLLVDKTVTFSQLKGTLDYILKALFGANAKTRYRPSYFPFTEPSAEVDVECQNCKGRGCNVCKHTGWLEILGAGMVHRNVFRSVGYNPDEVTGFAFGLGVERIAMLKYGVHDIRLFYENDRRFLAQF